MDILMLYWEWVGIRAGRETLYSFNHVFLAHTMSERSENRYVVSPTLPQPYGTISSYFLTRNPCRKPKPAYSYSIPQIALKHKHSWFFF